MSDVEIDTHYHLITALIALLKTDQKFDEAVGRLNFMKGAFAYEGLDDAQAYIEFLEGASTALDKVENENADLLYT
jgi:hypothetical protein